jgi:photosystem II stability/assembly factor-like uncharacterized protein
MRKLAAVLSFVFFGLCPSWGQWRPQASGTDVQLRGISAVSDQVAWASGAKGAVLRTVNGGETWTKINVPDAEALDFRDIQAFDQNTAFVLSIGPGEQSRIYKTTDGGKIWQLQFTNKDPKAFYDCFAFWDSTHAIALSDSVDGKFPLIATSDGASWNPVGVKKMPAALPNEGAFAASGTCIATFGKKDVWFATGGPAARVFHSSDRGVNWTVAETLILHGAASQGIFSVLFWSEKEGVVVGGDYQNPTRAEQSSATTGDGGKSWTLSGQLPRGYRSGLALATVPAVVGSQKLLLATGTTGTDYSNDGKSWRAKQLDKPEFISDDHGYNAVSCVSNVCWAVGPNGKIGRSKILSSLVIIDSAR